jgi:two-component system response regulator
MTGYQDAIEVLLVEDRAEDAEMCITELRRNHFANRIAWVKDGAEALAYLKDNRSPLRLILLDLKLPKISGVEVLEWIRASPDHGKTPVVVMTSSKESRDLSATYDLGVNSYIVKPVDFEKFCKVVRDIGMYWLLVNETPDVSSADE